ncbi:hypothetical protein B0J14DRAFT_670425 [Halenospora varia]|nr:hypothetical protein B0J14DRAFT_670425 [Halenospora varia]
MSLVGLKSQWTQFFPPNPTFTERNVGDQTGKVFLITGGNKGIGLELIKMLYPSGARIYMASRSEEAALSAISSITSTDPSKSQNLKFLHIDLDSLQSIRAAAEEFSNQENKLHILFQNAGIGAEPFGRKTKEGIEGHIGVNCIGPLLLAQLLLVQLQNATKDKRSEKGSVRVIWTSSLISESESPPGGVDFDILNASGSTIPRTNYAISKVGNYFLALEFARRYPLNESGILSICQNPGNLKTTIYNSQPWLLMLFVNRLLYPVKYGAWTGLFAMFHEDFEEGDYVIPWGRVRKDEDWGREDIKDVINAGAPLRFWRWCEERLEEHSSHCN